MSKSPRVFRDGDTVPAGVCVLHESGEVGYLDDTADCYCDDEECGCSYPVGNFNQGPLVEVILPDYAGAVAGSDPSGGDVRETINTLVQRIAQGLNTSGVFDGRQATDVQVMCLAEETGELIGAYRRWVGAARRSGDLADVGAELADVVLAAHMLAHYLHLDLWSEVEAKAGVVLTRGWREVPR